MTSKRRGWNTAIGASSFVAGVLVALIPLLLVTSAQLRTAQSAIRSDIIPTAPDTREALENIDCPAAIGPIQPETVWFTVTNQADTAQTARIPVFAGAPGSATYAIQCENTAVFAPSQTRRLSCTVSAAGIAGPALTVEVPGIMAHCGIAIINGPGALDGMWALRIAFALSLIMLLAGTALWLLRQTPRTALEWLRSILGILVTIFITTGASFTLFVPDAYWKMVAALAAFWSVLLLTVGLLILLAVEGFVMRLAARRENTSNSSL